MAPSFPRSGCVSRSALERVCSALERVCLLAISTSAKGWWGDKKGLCRIRHVAASYLKKVFGRGDKRHACVSAAPTARATPAEPLAPAAGVNASWPRLIGDVKRLVKYADIDANLRRVKNLDMTIVEITGVMLRAARSHRTFTARACRPRHEKGHTPGEREFADAV